jgi:PTS system nitrogen regulatory IIA component
MNVSEFLALRDVLVGLDVADKTTLLQRLAHQAAGEVGLKDVDVAAALFEREKLGSTGTGAGIAIPHARLRQVTRPIGVFARLKKAIAFDAIDEKPVDLVFVLLVPASNEGRHLSVLASVARKLRDAATQARLRKAGTAADVYEILCD